MAGWTGHIGKQHIRRPYEYFAKDHLGNVRVVFSPNGRSAMRVQEDHYYPFGMLMPYTHYASTSSIPNRLLYNSKELLNYLPGLRGYDYGARMYDAQVGRFHCIDRFAEKYESFTPYQYAANNPMKYIDVNGDSTFLLIWATANGEIGHAALAVSNYKTEVVKDKDGNIVTDKNGKPITKQVEDGTYTVYNLAPGNEKGVGATNYNDNVEAAYSVEKNVTRDQLFNKDVSNCNEKRAAEGVIAFRTDFKTDQKVKLTMDTQVALNQDYNAISHNCSDFAQYGVRVASGSRISATEKIPGLFYGSYTSTTPNQLFKQARGLANATILKDPGNLVNNTFRQGIKR